MTKAKAGAKRPVDPKPAEPAPVERRPPVAPDDLRQGAPDDLAPVLWVPD